ncbi:MAG: YafY family transcriptional regulator [Bacteroidetes bacterium]|nr:YafY family transcriptional regulator [Bacteroidota bacterium]
MNRIDRVSAILIQLQSKRVVKAQDIADRFNISLRTVYRDIKALYEAGVPVIGEAGSGFSIMDGYRLPPVMFTKEEATAFLTAGKMVEKFTDKATRSSYESALYKIKAVLQFTDKDYVNSLEEHIEVVRNPWLPDTGNDNTHLQNILQSIASKTIIDIGYYAYHNQQYSNRLVEPVGIFYLGTHWYMIGYCQLRKDYRHFRTDRIRYISNTGVHFNKQHPSLHSFIEKMKQEKELQQVIIRVDKHVLRYFGEQKYYNGFVSEKEVNGSMEMRFLTQSLRGFARFFLLFGEHADIIEPAELKDMLQTILADISKRLQ